MSGNPSAPGLPPAPPSQGCPALWSPTFEQNVDKQARALGDLYLPSFVVSF